jgi:predicted dehydrogenase
MGRYASGGDGEDTVIGGFTFKNGVFAALIDAKANPGGNYSDWRIGGTEGMIEIKGTVARLGKDDWVDIDYPHKNDPPVEGFERLSEATHYRGFLTEFQEFIASINEGRPPASTGYDGRASIEAALALRKAGETGQPVKFPL